MKSPVIKREIESEYFGDDFEDEPVQPIARRIQQRREESIAAQSSPVYPNLSQLPSNAPSASPGIVQASYQQSVPPYSPSVAGYGAGDWQTPLRQASEQLRYAIDQTPNGKTLSNEMRLRMLEMLLGNKAESAKPMQSADKTVNEFMGNQVLGFAALLDDSMQDNRGRYISAAYRFNEGLLQLQNLCPMKLKSVQFVNNYYGYAQYDPRPNEYRPGERFIVYMELENPTVRKIPDGFDVGVRIDYEVRDVNAKIVDRQHAGDTGEGFFTPKRDFFMGFSGELPKNLTPGQYQLRISVTDLNGNSMHYAEEQVPFRVVPALAGE
jgi:hypothetical protein